MYRVSFQMKTNDHIKKLRRKLSFIKIIYKCRLSTEVLLFIHVGGIAELLPHIFLIGHFSCGMSHRASIMSTITRYYLFYERFSNKDHKK